MGTLLGLISFLLAIGSVVTAFKPSLIRQLSRFKAFSLCWIGSIIAAMIGAAVDGAIPWPDALTIVFCCLVAYWAFARISKARAKKQTTWQPLVKKDSPQPSPVFSKKGNRQATRDLSHYSRAELLEVAFSYIDADSNFTQREVSVSQVTGTYVKGWCHERKAVRTFRLDSILQDVTLLSTGEVISVNDWARAVRKNG
ncbi:TPA: hypothetical protein ACSPZQ_002208 [Aeromonas veronii]